MTIDFVRLLFPLDDRRKWLYPSNWHFTGPECIICRLNRILIYVQAHIQMQTQMHNIQILIQPEFLIFMILKFDQTHVEPTSNLPHSPHTHQHQTSCPNSILPFMILFLQLFTKLSCDSWFFLYFHHVKHFYYDNLCLIPAIVNALLTFIDKFRGKQDELGTCKTE